MAVEGTVVMEGVRLVFRNFAGKEGMYNREGDRNFAVLLDDDVADAMAADGWNIKRLKAREEGEPEQAYLQISVGYKGRPPRIVMITSRGRNELSEDEVEILDWADIKNVDLIIRPYNWVIRENTPQEASGVKAYLKSMFVTIEEDELDLKYADLDDVPARGGRVDD
jgi:hypothetical protein